MPLNLTSKWKQKKGACLLPKDNGDLIGMKKKELVRPISFGTRLGTKDSGEKEKTSYTFQF